MSFSFVYENNIQQKSTNWGLAYPQWLYYETEVSHQPHTPLIGESVNCTSVVTATAQSQSCVHPPERTNRVHIENYKSNCSDDRTEERIGYLLHRKSSLHYNRSHSQYLGGGWKRGQILTPVSEEAVPKMADIKSQQRSITELAKYLRSHCDKVLDSSIPFVIDSGMLVNVSEAINAVMSIDANLEKANIEEVKYQDQVMFLSDVFEQTPSLCLTLAPNPIAVPANIDLTYFRNLQFLELRKISPGSVSGINSVKATLKRLKCSRCLDSIAEILTPSHSFNPIETSSRCGMTPSQPSMPLNLTCVWPELREVDFSFNRIADVTSASDSFELTPLVEILNLSRNKISTIDDSFLKAMNSLSVLNLNYNKVTIIPPLPPNLKVLLLAHNYITNLTEPSSSFSISNLKCLEMLDLSTNMISDENDLNVLRQLSSLTNVALMGNPLSYLENYRTKVCCNLNRLVLRKSFTLDKKKLSNSEIRFAVESMKHAKFVPYVLVDNLEPTLTSSFIAESSSSNNQFSKLKSLTQSFESTSSSLRSSCRKKPKIREIVLDKDDEEQTDDACAVKRIDVEVEIVPPPSQSKVECSYSSTSSSLSEKSEIIVLETKATITSIRETYGEEYWLLKQAGDKMKKLLMIPDRPAVLPRELLYSKSLPKANTSVYFDCDTSYKNDNDTLTDAELLVMSSGRPFNATVEVENLSSTNQANSLPTPKDNFDATLADDESANTTGGFLFYSCNSAEVYSDTNDGGKFESGISGSGRNFIFDFETEADAAEMFTDEKAEAKQFRIFQSGNCLTLAILYNYLYEFDPSDSIVLTKWDLKSLISLQEEHCDSETETVEFILNFDTIKKQLREKSFIMSAKDFSIFDKIVSPYIEEKILQEFADAMQCIKCKAQFSRGMINKVVKKEKGQAPKEVPVCPTCGSEHLVVLDDIPLPNNAVLSLEGTEFMMKEPLRSSTPASSNMLSKSIPKHSGQSSRNLVKAQASSLSSRVQSSGSNNQCNSDTDQRPTTASSSEKSSITVLNTRSDSDIEVLSNDSSSIEVLAKNSGDSGSSDIEAQEAIEVVEHASKSVKSVTMTESTSSGSCADSTCTAYERKLLGSIQPLSQPFSSIPSSLLSPSGSNSCSSSAGASTLTTYSYNSPSRTTAAPIRYDYNDFKIDHRLQLFCDLTVFKVADERLVMLTKVLVISDAAPFLCILIISNRKIYFYKIAGVEGDKPQEWLQKVSNFDVSKLIKLDVLIGRHGIGLDLSGKYYALILRDSQRTLNFVKFFMDICEAIEVFPMVRDFSQTQKALMSPKNPVSYFGILRFAVCDNDKAYATSAIVLTDEELMILADLNWLAIRCDNVTAKHTRQTSSLRQVEALESDVTFIRLIFEGEGYVVWELCFETEEEKEIFSSMLKTHAKNVPFISLSQPIEP